MNGKPYTEGLFTRASDGLAYSRFFRGHRVARALVIQAEQKEQPITDALFIYYSDAGVEMRRVPVLLTTEDD